MFYQARWEKIRKEELAREERRRAQLRAQLQKENELAEEAVQRQREQVSNGYVELVSSTFCCHGNHGNCGNYSG